MAWSDRQTKNCSGASQKKVANFQKNDAEQFSTSSPSFFLVGRSLSESSATYFRRIRRDRQKTGMFWNGFSSENCSSIGTKLQFHAEQTTVLCRKNFSELPRVVLFRRQGMFWKPAIQKAPMRGILSVNQQFCPEVSALVPESFCVLKTKTGRKPTIIPAMQRL